MGSRRALDQSRAPLLEALIKVAAADRWPFHTPGHKRGRGLDPLLAQVLGGDGGAGGTGGNVDGERGAAGAAAYDLTELTGLDELSHPQSVIAEAQALAAEAFGAARSFFSVNGSSAGVAAMIAASAGPGDAVILPRNAHRSVVLGLVASGALPVFITPPLVPDLGVPGPIGWDEIERALDEKSASGRVAAVFVVSPTYEGRVADVAGIAACLAALPAPRRPLLLVDEAHGPHFGFGGGRGAGGGESPFPTPALAGGADAAVHSLHKVAGSLTQSAILHVGRGAPPAFAPERWLTLFQTSSPSYLLMASLDAARRQLVTEGPAKLVRVAALAAHVRRELSRIPGLFVAESGGGDPTRLCLRVLGSPDEAESAATAATTATARAATAPAAPSPAARFAAALEAAGVYPELVEGDLLVLILTMADDTASARALIDACHQAAAATGLKPTTFMPFTARTPFETHVPRLAIPPRQAFAAPKEKLSLNAALGRVSAQTVSPSPPGTLLLIPGEVVDGTVLENALAAARQGLPIPMEIEVVCQP